MAEQQDVSKRIGLTRGKMVLIGILAVALLGVIYIQYGSDGTEDAVAGVDLTSETPSPPRSASPAPTSPTVAASQAADALKASAPGSLNPTLWKTPDLTTIVEYDPFALPPAFPRPVQVADGGAGEGSGATDAATKASQLADTVAKLRTDLDELQQRGVRVIVKQHDQYVAMIGDRTIHVGDEINGFTVTAIEPDGVRVEKKVQE